MVVWAEVEGTPAGDTDMSRLNRLSVLRSGPLLKLGEVLPGTLGEAPAGSSWASAESMNALSSLCYDFLKWNRFSIRSMKARAIFEWDDVKPWSLKAQEPRLRIIPGCDGPLVSVVRTAREVTT
jgi:hypothetical protein